MRQSKMAPRTHRELHAPLVDAAPAWAEREVGWLDTTDPLANLTISPSAEFVEEDSRTQAGEPTPSQIMPAIK